MGGEQIQDPLAVLVAPVGGNHLAENVLGILVVLPGSEMESANEGRGLVDTIDRPAGKSPGHFYDILLGVTAVDADGVQFH